MRSLTLAALALLLQPAVAHADESEFWLELGASGEVADGVSAKFEVEQRRRTGPDEYIVGAVADVSVGNGFEIGGGMEIHDIAGLTEIRPYQQLTYSAGPLELRSRIEERFYDGADQMALRLRQRVQLSDEIAPRLSASGSVELLYQLRDRTDGGPQRIDQWRLNAGLQYSVLPEMNVTAGYLYQIRPRDDGNTRRTHVPQLALTYRF
ncbi:DUF2490 domain-containing protein [Qipengyuania sp. JC766]|uniref:DUF2490 domain-containing protein n=1 Tax=Qipengyuania sp. JC766 TaxID=3232139 RepID=UPI0034591F8F